MSKLRSFVPKPLRVGASGKKRMIHEFAERSGMVYFGYVSQRSDDHHIVRGMTVSTKHVDDHYCIGTYDEYDCVFVERSDTLRSGKQHVWHILEFDLKSTADLPHSFIGSSTHGNGFHELLELKYPSLQPVQDLTSRSYPHVFTSHFNLYATPSDSLSAERIITPDVAASIGTHFKGLVIELTTDALYMYSEKPHLSPELLDTMLKNGAWLSSRIDENSRHL